MGMRFGVQHIIFLIKQIDRDQGIVYGVFVVCAVYHIHSDSITYYTTLILDCAT